MIEEAVDEARRVERSRTGGSRPAAAAARRDCAEVTVPDVHSTSNPFARDALDQRDHREQLADAGAMHPDQRPRRTRECAFAVAFVQARGMLLAALQTMRHERRRKRRRRRRQQRDRRRSVSGSRSATSARLLAVASAMRVGARGRRDRAKPRAHAARFRAPRRRRPPARESARRPPARRGRTAD